MHSNHIVNKLNDHNFLRTILANLPAVAFVIAPDGAVIVAEGKSIPLMGLTREDIIGSNAAEYYAQYPGFEDKLHRVLQGETVSSSMITPTGRNLEVTYSPLHNDQGLICGVIGIAQDVTERLQQEKASRENQSRLRAIFESAQDSIFMKDRSLKYIEVSPAMERLFGLPASELIGRMDEELFGLEASIRLHEVDRRVLAGEVVNEEETMPVAGTPRTFHVIKVPLRDSDGSVTGLCGIARDITDRRKTEQELRDSEEKFRGITSAALDAVVMMDQNGRVSFWNDAARAIFGYSEQEALGQILHSLVAPGRYHTHHMMRNFTTRGESPLFGRILELTARRKSGEEFPVELSLSSFRLRDQWFAVGIARDITERKRAERQLRESEEKFSRAFQSNAALMAITNMQTNELIDVNETFLRVLGFNREEVIGKTTEQLGLFVDAEGRHAAAAQIGRQGSVRNFEATIRAKSGELRCGIFSGEKIVLQGIDCMLTVMADITERKRAERALSESEAAYRAIFENTGSATVIIEDDTTISLANSEFERLSGRTRDEVEGKMRWTQFVVAEDLDMMIANHHRRREDPETVPRAYEFRLRDRSGAIKCILLNVVMIAGTRKSVASLTDITERKQAEQRLLESENTYRAIFENTGNATMIIEGDTTISLVNTEFEKVTGYTKAETEGKIPWTELVVEEDVDRMLHQHLLRRSKPEVALKSYEFRLRQKSGAIKDILLTIDIIPGTDRSVASFVDITARKQAARDQEELQRQLQQSQKMEAIGTMAGGIAHDFNNILTGILGFTELVRTEIPERSEIHDNLNEVLKAGQRARDLVRQILSFSRRAESEKSLVSLVMIVKEALKMIRSVTPSRIAIQQNLTASPERAILADPTQMHQILLNLCINAADAMPEGGILGVALDEVEIQDKDQLEMMQLSPGRYLKLTVRDTGVGMLPEIREHIFEPYFTTKQVGKGTGMGLAVVHGVVKEHSGGIVVSSEPGRGTAFEIYLPVAEETLTNKTQPIPITAAGRESVLFVDDERMITNLQRTQLSRWGYRVTATENSITALSLFRANPEDFDLVITDQSMPGLTGLKLAQAIHETSPDTPIILCTGFDEDVTRAQADAIGINAVLVKPVTGTEFSRTIRRVLEEASRRSHM